MVPDFRRDNVWMPPYQVRGRLLRSGMTRKAHSTMFGLGWQEILIVLVIFLFIFGAKRLPEIGAGLGKTVKEIRKIKGERKEDKKDHEANVISDIKKEVEEIPGIKEAKKIKETAGEIRKITKFLR
jgi:sec-independent protein translocase protein TatA